MSTEALVASEFVSTALALVLVYFFLKTYRSIRSTYLLGLPVGFSFLASSYFSLGVSLLYENDVTVFEAFLWLRLITLSFGFAFIAFAYYFSSRGERATKSYLYLISFISAISVLFILGISIVAPPFLNLPPVNAVDECFTIGNLIFLIYVIYHLVKRLELNRESISGLWAPTAFSLLLLGQYSSLISEADGSQTAFVFVHVARLASLILFIRIYYSSGGSRK